MTRSDGIYQVWRHNLEDTFDQIRDIIEDYPFISITTLIPGIVARPITHFEYSYQTVKCNVDLLNVIQLGFTFANSKGEFPKPSGDENSVSAATVQFNFHFNAPKDIQFQEFTDYLAGDGNLEVHRAEYEGIDLHYFGELMFSSGLVMNEDIKWISLHGAYDFGFLLKTLTCTHLPRNTQSFQELLNDHFPCLFDIKSLAYVAGLVPNGYITFKEICDTLHMNSEDVPSLTNTNRTSIATTNMQAAAGVDSKNCSIAFFKLIHEYFQNSFTDKAAKCGLIYGIDDSIHLSRSMISSTIPPTTVDHLEDHQPAQSPSGDTSSQQPLLVKGANNHNNKSDRLPPGMLRVKPSQISSFSRVVVSGATAAPQNSSSNTSHPPLTDDSSGQMDSKTG